MAWATTACYPVRSGNLYCVACAEVDCPETTKDDPARGGVPDTELRSSTSSTRPQHRATPLSAPPAANLRLQRTNQQEESSLECEVSSSLEAVTEKMAAARRRLHDNRGEDIAENEVHYYNRGETVDVH